MGTSKGAIMTHKCFSNAPNRGNLLVWLGGALGVGKGSEKNQIRHGGWGARRMFHALEQQRQRLTNKGIHCI